MISLQIVRAREGRPTVLLLPGVNRALLASEAAVQRLAERGLGVVTFHFSEQPFSVNLLKAGEAPAFLTKAPTIQDLAGEVAAVTTFLRESRGLDRVIPVTLSYSGVVSPLLTGFPVVIDTVPLTSMAAENPVLEQTRLALLAQEFYNPIWGSTNYRYWMDAAYRPKWTDEVDTVTGEFHLPTDRRDDMIEGYMSLSRAVEGFEWNTDKLDAKTRHIFLLAENDTPSLQRHQIETYLKLGSGSMLFLVLGTGHVIPTEQPAVFASIVDRIASGQTDRASGVVVIDPVNGTETPYAGQAAETFLRDRLTDLPISNPPTSSPVSPTLR